MKIKDKEDVAWTSWSWGSDERRSAADVRNLKRLSGNPTMLEEKDRKAQKESRKLD